MSTQALSSLNRAALSAKEGYWWINAAALALSALIGKMSVGAYASAGTIDNAWVCVTCQALAIALAILARRALTAQMPVAGIGAGLGALGCAWWASHGLALAWASGGDPANVWMVFFLTALEPALFLLAEHVREGREALRAHHAKEEAETAAELARVRERDAARWGPRLAATGGLALGVVPAGANASEVAPTLASIPERPAIMSTIGYASARDHAIALKSAHPAFTQEQIGHRVGAPRSTVVRWLRNNNLSVN